MTTLLTPEAIAERYSTRPGCRFVGHLRIAIAMYVLNVKAVVVNPTEVPTVDEFILRGLKLGYATSQELSLLLGLDSHFIESRLADLLRTEVIGISQGLATDTDIESFSLTEKGKTVARTLEVRQTKELSIPGLVYHGFLRKFWPVTINSLLRPKEAEEQDLEKLRHIPSRPPKPEEIDINDLSKYLKKMGATPSSKPVSRGTKNFEVLKVRGILSTKTMYLPAVLLEYQRVGLRRTLQVAFAIDGVIDESHETGFVKCDGLKKLSHLFPENIQTDDDVVRAFTPQQYQTQALSSLAPAPQVEKLRQLRGDRDKLEAHLNTKPDTRAVQAAELEEKDNQIKKLLEELKGSTKVLRGPDHSRLLRDSLRTATERLIIVSAFIAQTVVDELFLRYAESMFDRGVEMWIAFGMRSDERHRDDRRNKRSWQVAENRLFDLEKQYPDKCRILDAGKTEIGTHEKILLKDDEFVAIGSYNWLSYTGNDRRFEATMVNCNPALVNEEKQRLMSRFQ